MFTEHQLIIGEQQSDVVLPEYLQLWKHLYLYYSDLVGEQWAGVIKIRKGHTPS